MCGIYAVRGSNAGQRVVQGLKRLEYRGYDSWGMASLNHNGFELEKSTGALADAVNMTLPDSDLALGHTRWATHGGVTKLNAHPHSAQDGSFVLVQNGVVENYQELKKQLAAEGYKFVSETDTEVIVRLIEKVVKEAGKNGEGMVSFEAVLEAFSRLDGRNTIAVMTKNGELFAVRNGSPLIVASNGRGEYFFSSDTLSVAADAVEYAIVSSGQAVEINGKGVLITNLADGKKAPAKFQELNMEAAEVDHDGYPSFMIKEIHEQAEVFTSLMQNPEELYRKFTEEIRKSRRVYVTGAGSAYFAAWQIAHYLRGEGVAAQALPAYEAESFRELMDKKDLLIAVSQSGETADTNEVVEWAKERGVKIASIVNMAGSTLSELADFAFKLGVGPEIAVASTKAFLGQVVWGRILADFLAEKPVLEIKESIEEFQKSIAVWLADEQLQTSIRDLASDLLKHQHAFILGRGQLFAAALEGALKIKEISYLHAEGFSGGELKHGVIALVEKGTPVFALIAEDAEKAAMMNAAAEVAARGGHVIGISPENNELFANWIPLPDSGSYAMPAAVIPFQLLTCFMAEEQGRNPDKPRNLAKSVTVK